MEFYYYSPSETFVVLTADQFVGRDDGLLEQQRQDIHVKIRGNVQVFPQTPGTNQSRSSKFLYINYTQPTIPRFAPTMANARNVSSLPS